MCHHQTTLELLDLNFHTSFANAPNASFPLLQPHALLLDAIKRCGTIHKALLVCVHVCVRTCVRACVHVRVAQFSGSVLAGLPFY